jgi:thiol:disulfide interchange protein DsbA
MRLLPASLIFVLGGVAIAAQPSVVEPVAEEGKTYLTLPVPVPTETGNKTEVLEAFSYGCIHCFNFEPAMRAWKQGAPADVQVVLLPATFQPLFALFARGFYAARSLGVMEKTHEAVFDTVWTGGFQVQNEEQLADLYAKLGVKREDFVAALHSPAVNTAVQAATDKATRLKLEGTPSLYVDGKYQVLLTGASSYDDIIRRLDSLVAKARAEHGR